MRARVPVYFVTSVQQRPLDKVLRLRTSELYLTYAVLVQYEYCTMQGNVQG